MTQCTKCNDTGFVGRLDSDEPLKKCSCVFSKELKAYLPKMFHGDQIAKKFPYDRFKDKNLIAKGGVRKFGSLCNTMLTNAYLRNPNYTYSVVGYTTFVEQFFQGEVTAHYEADLLVLLVYGGYPHKMVEGYLMSLLKDRELNRVPTLVFVDKSFSDSLIKDRLGVTVFDHINAFTKVPV